MLEHANLPNVEARLDYAMFLVESIKRIGWYAQHPDRLNEFNAILKSGIEGTCTAPEREVRIAEAKALLPIKSLQPWVKFLAEASRSYQDSTPFLLQNCGKIESGMELIGRVTIQ